MSIKNEERDASASSIKSNNPHHFENHPDEEMLQNMYDAITRLNLWDWLKSFRTENGFIFESTPEIQAISSETSEINHSGASFVFCMRQMEQIAKKE